MNILQHSTVLSHARLSGLFQEILFTHKDQQIYRWSTTRDAVAAKAVVPFTALVDVEDFLIGFLCMERGNPHSFWRPYLDLLPQTFATPLWWSGEEEIDALLQGTNLQHAAKEAAHQWKSHWEKMRVDEFWTTLQCDIQW